MVIVDSYVSLPEGTPNHRRHALLGSYHGSETNKRAFIIYGDSTLHG